MLSCECVGVAQLQLQLVLKSDARYESVNSVDSTPMRGILMATAAVVVTTVAKIGISHSESGENEPKFD